MAKGISLLSGPFYPLPIETSRETRHWRRKREQAPSCFAFCSCVVHTGKGSLPGQGHFGLASGLFVFFPPLSQDWSPHASSETRVVSCFISPLEAWGSSSASFCGTMTPPLSFISQLLCLCCFSWDSWLLFVCFGFFPIWSSNLC